MTQSEYIARGKQGQEESRPERGCRVQVRNNQSIVQRCSGITHQARIWYSVHQSDYKRLGFSMDTSDPNSHGIKLKTSLSSCAVSAQNLSPVHAEFPSRSLDSDAKVCDAFKSH
ncbi:hypothetical protein Cadr_000004401 [Camelus dromedarius]|uniref:Uncharacterized protein n=1 Tax=Camelus dromedarius TaxID=9838 RepID=A0A5N4EDB4_CAMDR|nr:hypothetical protein Cadr_000004401 [Camelus dromedarius]